MAIGDFYGLTGVNLVLSDINIQQFKELVKSLDTNTNRPILNLLKDDLEYLKKSLESLPFQYADREAIIASAKLKGGRYADEDEKEDLEIFLRSQRKVLSRHFVKSDNSMFQVSDCSFEILKALYNRKDKVDTLLKFITVGEDNSGVMVFGQTLYRLKTRSRSYLNNLLYNRFGHYSNSEDYLENFKDEVDTLNEYVSDTARTSVNQDSPVKPNLEFMKTLTSNMGVDYFNNLLGENFTFSDYFNSSKELVEVGVVGFNVFSKEFFRDFVSTVSFDSLGDLSIYPGTDLFDFILDLREILENYRKIYGGVEE